MSLFFLFFIPGVVIPGACLYLWHINSVTKATSEATTLSPNRWTVEQIEQAAHQIAENPIDMVSRLPPPTGRRYVVVGGSGFVGGWIVLHLLLRGEKPENIRILDIRPPVREDLRAGKAAKVGFIATDISDLSSVRAAFSAEWLLNSTSNQGITVFHTVAVIRYFERKASLLSRSTPVNVDGTRNVLAVAREAGVDIFVFTSTVGVLVRVANFWIWPWQSQPKDLVQIVRDRKFVRDSELREHQEFFSNYAYTKYLAERLVCEADDPAAGFRAGCLQPGSSIYGHGSDLSLVSYLERGNNPTFLDPSNVQSCIYVENASYGHLVYEQRLLEALSAPPTSPIQNLSGQAYLLTDPGDPVQVKDIRLALATLTKNRTQFQLIPFAPLFAFSYLLELYHILQSRLPGLPPLAGDLQKLQPSIFYVASLYLRIDDSRARLPPSEGGLGYEAPWTTLDGVCHVVNQYSKDR